MEHSKLPARRRHSDELRAQVLSECAQEGASVAGIALAHGLNANLVHKWRRQARELHARGALRTSAQTEFIALALPPVQRAAPVQPDIRMELRRGAATMNIRWPVVAAPECATPGRTSNYLRGVRRSTRWPARLAQSAGQNSAAIGAM